ncbi:MAG: lysylphosphatidylglycerol synthase transmembrane domain-containing protein [Methylotetracoccus sp.]
MIPESELEVAVPRRRSIAARGWQLIKYVLAAGLLAYLALSVDWPKVWASARAVSLPWLAISLFYIPVGIWFIAVRYRCLIDKRVSLPAMLRLVVFQAAISTFLANVAGSLGYIGILAKVYRVPTALAVQSTIVARLAEMLMAMVAAGVLAALAWRELETLRPQMSLAIGFSLAVLIGATLAVIAARLIPDAWVRPVVDEGGAEPGFVRKLIGFVVRVVRLDARYLVLVVPPTLLYSLILQIVIAVAMYCNAYAFHLDVSFVEAAFIGVVSSFIAGIPITVFGGLGVYEVSTVGLFVLFGVPADAATGMILVVRTLFFIVMGIAFAVVRAPER